MRLWKGVMFRIVWSVNVTEYERELSIEWMCTRLVLYLNGNSQKHDILIAYSRLLNKNICGKWDFTWSVSIGIRKKIDRSQLMRFHTHKYIVLFFFSFIFLSFVLENIANPNIINNTRFCTFCFLSWIWGFFFCCFGNWCILNDMIYLAHWLSISVHVWNFVCCFILWIEILIKVNSLNWITSMRNSPWCVK